MEFTWHIRDNTSLPSSSIRQQSTTLHGSHERPSDGDPPQSSGSQGDRTRMPSSCIHCKRRKIRCRPQDDGRFPCQRCKKKGFDCEFMPVIVPPGRKQLVRDIQQRDQVIRTLLRQVHSSEETTHLRIASFPVPQPTSNEVKLWLERQQQSQLSNLGNSAVESYAMLTQLEVPSDDELDEEGSSLSVPASSSASESALDALVRREKRRKASPKLHSLPGADAPLGLIAAMSLRTEEVAADEDDSSNSNGYSFDIANKQFFAPGPFANLELRKIINEHEAPPEILTTGLVKPADVEKLFKLFFEGINITLKLFDPVLHTPINVLARSPFLFTVICAISSRFYVERPDLYQLLIHFAKASAASALIDGYKSIEMCQAYMILAMYPPRVKSFQEERGYLYLGLAVRVAVDLNLNRPSVTKVVNDQHERELLNITRTWLVLFAMERASSVLVGRTLTLPDDPVASNCKNWWHFSRFNLSWDKHVSEYAEHARICGAFHTLVYSDPKDPQMFNHHVNHHQICLEYDDKLRDFLAECRRIDMPGQPSAASVYQAALMPWTVNYTRVVILGFGLHVCLKKQRRIEAEDPLIIRSMEAATVVLNTFMNKLGPSNYFRYCPNNQILFTVYCCVYLLRFLLPQFEGLLLPEQHDRILQIVQQVHDALSSPSVAVDEKHISAMYAKFLHALMKRIRKARGGYQNIVPMNAPMLATTSAFSQSDSIRQSSSQAAARVPIVDTHSPMHSLFDPSNQPPVRYQEPISPRTVPAGHLNEQVPMQVEQTFNGAFGVTQAPGIPADDTTYWNDLMWPGVGWPMERASIPPQQVPKPQQGFHSTPPQPSSASTPGYAADPYHWLGLGSNPSVEGWFAQYATHPHAQQHPNITNSPTQGRDGQTQSQNPQYDNYGEHTHYYAGQGSQTAPSKMYH